MASVLFLLISSLLILQLPSVQRALANRYLRGFSQVVGFKTTIQNINFSWFDRLELDGVLVEDTEHNKMFEISHISLNYKLSNLIQGANINLDAIYVDSARVYFTRIQDHDTVRSLNINVFINQINKQYASGKQAGPVRGLILGKRLLKPVNLHWTIPEKTAWPDSITIIFPFGLKKRSLKISWRWAIR